MINPQLSGRKRDQGQGVSRLLPPLIAGAFTGEQETSGFYFTIGKGADKAALWLDIPFGKGAVASIGLTREGNFFHPKP